MFEILILLGKIIGSSVGPRLARNFNWLQIYFDWLWWLP